LRTKPAVIGIGAALLAAAILPGELCRPVFAAPVPTLLLYPRSAGNSDDAARLIDLRKKLRADSRFEVLTYGPESLTIVRAAEDAHHPELLKEAMSSDPERLMLARAVGAQFYLVVADADDHGKIDVHLVETVPGHRSWTLTDEKTDDMTRDVERQALDALLHPAPLPSAGIPAVRPVPAKIVAPPVPTPLLVPPVSSLPVLTPKAPQTAVTTLPVSPPPAPAAVVPPAQVSVSAAPPAAPAVVSPVPVSAPPAGAPVPAPSHVTEVVPGSTPIPAPTRIIKPAAPSVPRRVAADDLSGVKSLLGVGDDDEARGDFAAAILAYRDAVNGAPLSVTPRLKLAEVYLEAGMRDKALDEAQRALEIIPGSPAIQQFLMRLDAETGTADGAVARYTALVSQNPQDPMARVELGDAYWNNNSLSQAEDAYKTAENLTGPGTATAQTAAAHLARLYAAQARYGDSLKTLSDAGPAGYALALGIVQSRVDMLSSTLDSAQDSFNAGKSTHADFYKAAGDVCAQAQKLADFVVKVTPPPAFKLSHLYRIQATHLLAQEAAVLVSYIETSDATEAAQAAQLEKEAQTEMLMAHAAEQKLGLWGGKQSEAKN
jgi:tetratricopeptide (TPR) repeat protein